MLTKIGIAALLGTIGTAALGGVAKADEPCNTGFIPPPASSVTVVAPPPVRVAAPSVVVTPVDYRYSDGYNRYADGDGRVRYGYDDGYARPGVYYRDGRGDGWRDHEWREHERREHERHEWREHHRRGWGW